MISLLVEPSYRTLATRIVAAAVLGIVLLHLRKVVREPLDAMEVGVEAPRNPGPTGPKVHQLFRHLADEVRFSVASCACAPAACGANV